MDTIHKGAAYTDAEIQSAMRDKVRLDFIQEWKGDLRESHDLWHVCTSKDMLSDGCGSAREAIDVAMSFAKDLKPNQR